MSYCNTEINIEMDQINKANNDSILCCICLDEIKIQEIKIQEIKIQEINRKLDGSDYLTTSCCNHRIHKRCFVEWLFSKSNRNCICPMCRNNVDDLQDKIHISFVLVVLCDLTKENTIDKYHTKDILQTYYKEPIIDYFYIECPQIIIENVRVVTYYRIIGFIFLLLFILMFSYMFLNVILNSK
jgi:hypothetical protein